MSDLSDGQRAIIRDLIAEELTSREPGQIDKLRLLIRDEADQRERHRIPFWKKPTFWGTLVGVAVLAAPFIISRLSGSMYLYDLFHTSVGTYEIISEQILRKNTEINRSITELVADNMNEEGSNPINQKIIDIFSGSDAEFFSAFSSNIYRAVERRPILVYQGEYIFGKSSVVTVSNKKCIDDTLSVVEVGRAGELSKLLEECVYFGEVESPNQFSVPFYGAFWTEDGTPAHDAHLVFTVQREAKDPSQGLLDPYPRGAENITIEVISDTGADVTQELNLSEFVERVPTSDKIFYANIGEAYRQRHKHIPGIGSDRVYLHSVRFSVLQDHLRQANEVIAVRCMVILNREPLTAIR